MAVTSGKYFIAADRTIKVGRFNTRYWAEGDGSPVILIHGWRDSAKRRRKARGHRWVVPTPTGSPLEHALLVVQRQIEELPCDRV